MAETGINPTAEQAGLTQPEQRQLTAEQKMVQAIDKTRAILAKRNRGTFDPVADVAELAQLVGPDAANRLALGQELGKDVKPQELQGEIGRLREEARQAQAETTPNQEKEGWISTRPLEQLKRAVGGLFAENGVLNLKSWAKSANETRKDWWGRAKEFFGGKKNENADQNAEAVSDDEAESTWQALKRRGSELKGEAGIRLRELLKGGKENGGKLAELLRDNADARDQVIALGFNITMNALKANPAGILLPAAVKYVVDTRAYSRAAAAGEGQSFVERKFQTGTNREAYNNKQEAQAYIQLKEQFAKLYNDMAAAEGAYKWVRGIDKRTKNPDKKAARQIELYGKTAKDGAEAVPGLLDKYNQAKAAFYDFKDKNIARFEELAQKYEGSQDVSEDEEAKAQGIFGKIMRGAGRVARTAVDVMGVYSNIGKKALVDAQGAGNTVDDFIRNNVDAESQMDEEAVLAKLRSFAEKLNPANINARLESDKKGVEADLIQFRDLLRALIDLGLIGDMIPRNIGHKQINGFFQKIGLGNFAGREGLFRNPDFVAKLRAEVQAQAEMVARNLAGSTDAEGKVTYGAKVEKTGRKARKAVGDIIDMGGKNAGEYLAARERHMALRLRSADILGMFANGVIVAEVTRGAELRAAGQRIADNFNHEHQLAGVEHTGGGPRQIVEQGGGPSRANISEVRPVAGAQTSLREAGVTNANDQLNIGGGREVDYVNNNGTLRLNADGTFRDGQAAFINREGFNNLGEVIAGDLRNVVGVEPGTFNQIMNATIDLARDAGRTFTPEEMALITRGFNGEFGQEVADALRVLGNTHTGQENISMIFDALGINA